MATVQESINVSVPLSQAYNQWAQFEDFPHVMSGVDSVQQLDDTTVHFKTSIAGVKRDYDAQITVQQPDQRVTWESLDEPRNAGTVWFEALNPPKPRSALNWPGNLTPPWRSLERPSGLIRTRWLRTLGGSRSSSKNAKSRRVLGANASRRVK
jgi:hypothetical protein